MLKLHYIKYYFKGFCTAHIQRSQSCPQVCYLMNYVITRNSPFKKKCQNNALIIADLCWRVPARTIMPSSETLNLIL